jgi:hypothetical protein
MEAVHNAAMHATLFFRHTPSIDLWGGLFPTHGPLHRGEGTYELARLDSLERLPHSIFQTHSEHINPWGGLFPTHGPLHRGEGTYGLARLSLSHSIFQTHKEEVV